jgi:glucokinase
MNNEQKLYEELTKVCEGVWVRLSVLRRANVGDKCLTAWIDAVIANASDVVDDNVDLTNADFLLAK